MTSPANHPHGNVELRRTSSEKRCKTGHPTTPQSPQSQQQQQPQPVKVSSSEPSKTSLELIKQPTERMSIPITSPHKVLRIHLPPNADLPNFPNNASLPLLIYKACLLSLSPLSPLATGQLQASQVSQPTNQPTNQTSKQASKTADQPDTRSVLAWGEQLLVKNGWTAPWPGVVYDYHHYHSNAWEVLLCVRGQAKVLFGGAEGAQGGVVLSAEAGDVVLIPPGVVHKEVSASKDFQVLGSYPDFSSRVHPRKQHKKAQTEKFAVDIWTCDERPSQQVLDNIRTCRTPTICPVYGERTPWPGGFGALLC